MHGQLTDEILHRLRAHGGRVTQSRRIVIDAMVDSPEHHLTATDVIAAVRAREPGFHESSVYRTLDRLVELDVVERMQLGPGPAVFHLAERPHQHLVCERCGTVTEAPADLLDDVAARVQKRYRFRLRTDAATMHGLCGACQAEA